MAILVQLMSSFLATAAFGIIFNAPKKSLVKCGLVGMGGWLLYYLIEDRTGDAVLATLLATIFVGVVSQLLARFNKMPVIIFSVAGIIPLVPGGMAYNAMRNFIWTDYNLALTLGGKVTMLSGSIAFGLVISEVINQLIRKFTDEKVKNKQL